MKQVCSILLLVFVAGLCSCSSTEVETKDHEEALAHTQMMNLSNGGQMGEKSDGTVYYIAYEDNKSGVYEATDSGEKELPLQEDAAILYLADDKLYYVSDDTDILYALDFLTGETSKIYETGFQSIVRTSDGVFFIPWQNHDQLFFCADNAEAKVWETKGIPDDYLYYLYTLNDELYVVGNNSVYYLGTGHEAEKIFESQESLYKFFKLCGNYYAVGDVSIFKFDDEGDTVNIAPQYFGCSWTVTTHGNSIIYSGLGGTYKFNCLTERTKRISTKIYHAIYVVHDKIIGVELQWGSPDVIVEEIINLATK